MDSTWGESSATRCVVTLTFDIDGPSATLRRNPELADHPSAISMGEFGPRVGTPRILDLLDRHGILATFFVPGWVAERNKEVVKDVANRGHEVAHHGYLHAPPSSLGPEEDEGEILDLDRRFSSRSLGADPGDTVLLHGSYRLTPYGCCTNEDLRTIRA